MRSSISRMFVIGGIIVLFAGWLAQRAFAGPVQIHLDHWQNGGDPQAAEKWVDGNLHRTNSTYAEGDTVPTRFVLDALPDGTHVLTFKWLAAKKQSQVVRHAHDYMRTFDASYNSGSPAEPFAVYPDPCLPRVQGNAGDICTLNSAFTSSWAIPADGNLAPGGFTGAQAAGFFRMWNGTITGVSGYTYDPDASFTDTTYNSISVTFTVSGGPQDVVLATGAHLALDSEWTGTDNGAADINGSPYHWSYVLVSGGVVTARGNRDRSMQIDLTPGSITVAKECLPVNDPNATFNFTFGNPSGVPALPASFTLGCDEDESAVVTTSGPLTFTFEETPTQGWDPLGFVCTDDGTGLELSGGGYVSGANPVSITFQPGDHLTCTFTNRQAEMPVTKLIAGRTPTCAVSQTGEPIPPCTDAVVGTLPQFQLNLYPDAEPGNPAGQPLAFPSGPLPSPPFPSGATAPLATILIPPPADPPGPIGIPFTICEMNLPAGWSLPNNGVTFTVTGPTPVSNPTVYTPTASDGDDRCFDVLIPSGTTTFEIHVNNIPTGTIVVKKESVGGDGTFTFTGTGGGGLPASFTLTTSTGNNHKDQTSFTVEARTVIPPNPAYGVTETGVPAPTVAADWTTTVSCLDDGGNPVNNTSFGVPPGATITCSFVNTKRPKLTVVKDLDPNGDPGRFDLKINGTTYKVAAGDGEGTGAQYALINSNTFAEVGNVADLDNYAISAVCDGGSGLTNTGAGAWSLTLAAGDNVTCTITNKRKPTVTLTKVCDPQGDSGTFTLQIGGTTLENATCGGSLGPVVVPFAPVTVGESNADPVLSHYETTILCSPVGAGSATAGDNSLSWTVDLTNAPAATAETCTITNKRRPTLRVDKICEPTDDPGRFNLQIDSITVGTGTNAVCGGTTGAIEYAVGSSHTAGETGGTDGTNLTNLSNYDRVIGGDCAANGAIALAAGQNAVCTITNKRKPKLTIVKIARFGAATFHYDVDGPNGFSNNPSINTTGNPYPAPPATAIGTTGKWNSGPLSVGDYSILEDLATTNGSPNNSPWFLETISCSESGTNTTWNQVDPAHVLSRLSPPTTTINLAYGDNVTCTYTNTNDAGMPVYKTINGHAMVNCGAPSGGTVTCHQDTADGPTVTVPQFEIAVYFPGTPAAFPNSPFPHAFIPPNPFDPVGPVETPITMCELNVPAPWTFAGITITMTPFGGSPTVLTSSTTPAAPVPYPAVDPGNPTAVNWCWDFTIPDGTEEWRTDINNTAAKLAVRKLLAPSNDPGLFTLKIDSTSFNDNGTGFTHNESTGPQTVTAVQTGTLHTVSELAFNGSTNLNDYDQVIGGDCAPDGTITLLPGDSKECTITNTRKPRVTLSKVCNPQGDSGTFTLQIGATSLPNVACGGSLGPVTVPFAPVTVGESNANPALTHYETTISCSPNAAGAPSDTDPSDNNLSWTVDLTNAPAGTVQTCTITNTRRPTLTVVKICDPPTDTGRFNLQIDGLTVGTGLNAVCGGTTGAVEYAVGSSHVVGETGGTDGVTLTNLANYDTVIGGACLPNGAITLAAGQNAVCTITNHRLPQLIVRKVVNTNSGREPSLPSAFSLHVKDSGGLDVPATPASPQPGSTTGTTYTLSPGSYTVSEDDPNPLGYINVTTDATNGDCAGSGNNNTITLAYGDVKTCTITNNDLPLSAVTNSALCTFDVDPNLAGDQFNLIYTPDGSAYKLNASNPGQFFYNVFYVGSGATTLTLTLPYPFVTQGATPIHLYSSVTQTTANGSTCYIPGATIGSATTQVVLANYSPQQIGSTTTVNVSVPFLPGGFAYINIHLDYGLKGTTNYAARPNFDGTLVDAVDAKTGALLIPDLGSYQFSDTTGGLDSILNRNLFKKTPGIGGLVLDQSEALAPVEGATVEIYSGTTLLASLTTDADGWYFWNFKHTGKAADFTVKLTSPDTQQQTVTLKANAFVVVSFIVP